MRQALRRLRPGLHKPRALLARHRARPRERPLRQVHPRAELGSRSQKQPVAHVVVTGSGSLLVNTAGMLTRKTRRLALPDALLEELGRIHSPLARHFGVMPMQAFLQREQAFLAELKARPHLLPEAAALMGPERRCRRPVEADRVPPPAAAATDQDQAGEGGHSGEGQRSPEVELLSSLRPFTPETRGTCSSWADTGRNTTSIQSPSG